MPRPQVVALVLFAACKGDAKPTAEAPQVPRDAERIAVPADASVAGVLDAASIVAEVVHAPDAGVTRVGQTRTKGDDAPTRDGDGKAAVTRGLTEAPPPIPVAPPGQQATEATKQRARDPRNHLQAEQGTLSVGKIAAKPGAIGEATIEVKPATGWHVSTDYPTKLWLEAPAGVVIEKWLLTAGGKSGRGDATALTEESLAFTVKATPHATGAFAVTGVLSFGICERDSCHPKTQAITIQVAAN